MNHSTKVALATAAAGVLLLGGAGTFATLASGSAPGVGVGLQEWSDLIIALGLVGYAAALLVAAFGTPRSRHVRG